MSISESTIKFEYLGDHYYPSLSLLNITIDLDTTGFNNNAYQQFRIIEKTATIHLKEIYPFTKEERQFISSTSTATSIGGRTITSIQAAGSAATGVLSTSLIRLQIMGELVQLLRFISIKWPPNVAQYFITSHIDPSSMVLPVDFMRKLNGPLDDRNYSMLRVFHEYETSPFFTRILTINYQIC